MIEEHSHYRPIALGLSHFLPVTLTIPQASLHIDRDNEEYYLEVMVEMDPFHQLAAHEMVRSAGLAIIPDDECEPEYDFEAETIRFHLYDATLECDQSSEVTL